MGAANSVFAQWTVLGWVFILFLSELGLILLLFLVGLEFDFGHLRWHGKAALGISLTHDSGRQ